MSQVKSWSIRQPNFSSQKDSHRVGARYTIPLFGKSIRAGSATPPFMPIVAPSAHVTLWSMYGQALVKVWTQCPHSLQASEPPDAERDALQSPQSTSPQLPHPSELSQLGKLKSPSSESWRPKQNGNGSGAHPAQVRDALQLPARGEDASRLQVRPSVLHSPTGTHCPEQSASLSQSPPWPQQNRVGTHRANGPGQYDASWQVGPSRVPPSHCPVVFGPHVHA